MRRDYSPLRPKNRPNTRFKNNTVPHPIESVIDTIFLAIHYFTWVSVVEISNSLLFLESLVCIFQRFDSRELASG